MYLVYFAVKVPNPTFATFAFYAAIDPTLFSGAMSRAPL